MSKFTNYPKGWDHYDPLRFLKDDDKFARVYPRIIPTPDHIPDNPWRWVHEHPKGIWVEVLLADKSIKCAHWASDLSGEEQPPFQGWFTCHIDYKTFLWNTFDVKSIRKTDGYHEVEEPFAWRWLRNDPVNKTRLPLKDQWLW